MVETSQEPGHPGLGANCFLHVVETTGPAPLSGDGGWGRSPAAGSDCSGPRSRAGAGARRSRGGSPCHAPLVYSGRHTEVLPKGLLGGPSAPRTEAGSLAHGQGERRTPTGRPGRSPCPPGPHRLRSPRAGGVRDLVGRLLSHWTHPVTAIQSHVSLPTRPGSSRAEAPRGSLRGARRAGRGQGGAKSGAAGGEPASGASRPLAPSAPASRTGRAPRFGSCSSRS